MLWYCTQHGSNAPDPSPRKKEREAGGRVKEARCPVCRLVSAWSYPCGARWWVAGDWRDPTAGRHTHNHCLHSNSVPVVPVVPGDGGTLNAEAHTTSRCCALYCAHTMHSNHTGPPCPLLLFHCTGYAHPHSHYPLPPKLLGSSMAGSVLILFALSSLNPISFCCRLFS